MLKELKSKLTRPNTAIAVGLDFVLLFLFLL